MTSDKFCELFMLIIIFLPSILVIIYAVMKNKKRNKSRKELIKPLIEQYPEGDFFQIRCTSKKRFDSFWKFFPWESYGFTNSKISTL